jgi:hypothetical protein
MKFKNKNNLSAAINSSYLHFKGTYAEKFPVESGRVQIMYVANTAQVGPRSHNSNWNFQVEYF